MKMKIIGALLLSAQLLTAAQTLQFKVTEFETFYKYEYFIDRNQFDHDVSHFELYVCDDAEITNPLSNLGFMIDFNHGDYKFDDIPSNNQPDVIWFSFESPNVPDMGSALIKAGRDSYTYNAVVPSCVVPEPKTSLFGLIGSMLLFRRKRHV